MRNKQQKKRIAAMAAFCIALLAHGLTAVCQPSNSDCIKQVESYYATLNDFSKYSSSMSETAVVVYFAEGNIVYNDLRTFQTGRSIDKQKDVKAYLVTLQNLSSSGKVEYKATVKKPTVRTKTVSTEDYKGTVVIMDVSKTIKYKGETKEFDETITMNEKGQIVKIETSPHFHIPWHEQIGLFDPLDKEWNFQVWGSTKGAFGSLGFSMANKPYYFSFGWGADYYWFFKEENAFSGMDIILQSAANFSYWSLGLNAGISLHAIDIKKLNCGMLLAPFVSINLFERISLSVGYNFNLINNNEFNGLKFGLGLWY